MAKNYTNSGKMTAKKSMASMAKSPINAKTNIASKVTPDTGRRGVLLNQKPKRMPKVGCC